MVWPKPTKKDLSAAKRIGFRRHRDSELGSAGIEPWLISLVNADLSTRYVVAISAEGEPLSMMQMAMTDAERIYCRVRPAAAD